LIELRLSHCERLQIIEDSALHMCRTLETLTLPSHSFSMSCWVFVAPWERGLDRYDVLRKVDLIGSKDYHADTVCVLIVAEARCLDLDVQMGGWGKVLSADKWLLSEASIFGEMKTVPLRPPM
jgi:hypothetical protein